jgi:excisionase family DNA binding protein
MEEYLSTKQIAKMLGLKTITIRRWIISGKLPAILLGKEYRVKSSDMDTFLEQKRVKVK